MMKPFILALAATVSLTGVSLAADAMNMDMSATPGTPSTTTEMTPVTQPGMTNQEMAKPGMKMHKMSRKEMMSEKAGMAEKGMMSEKGGCSKMMSNDAKMGKLDIVDTAMMDSQFSTFGKAVEAAGLTETLKGKGPFTIFAPTNAAFEALPKGALDNLLKPENREKLQQVLTYHVVAGKVSAKEVMTMKEAKTVEGASLKVMNENGGVMINNANVTKADIKTKNGVIHAIDQVLMPAG